MKHKILLADDSSTIQKVIKITLANGPFEITVASSEEDLYLKLDNVKPDLILLDYNLSENLTGLELTSKIKNLSSSSRVLLLLGTFDSVDDNAIKKSGASDKIVKPFDSTKFISLCHQILDDQDTSSTELPPVMENEDELSAEKNDDEDQWTMGKDADSFKLSKTESVAHDPDLNHVEKKENGEDLLKQEIQNWGMQVPPPLNESVLSHEEVFPEDLPPIMESKKEADADGDHTKYPIDADLDYPDIPPSSEKIEFQNLHEKVDNTQTIEAQIHDEVADDLWNVDEYISDKESHSSSSLESVEMVETSSGENFEDDLKIDRTSTPSELIKKDESSETIQHSQDLDGLKEDILRELEGNFDEKWAQLIEEKIEKSVEKHVKEYMDKMYAHYVEKVSWDVIPDLAENLIKKELSTISEKVQSDL